MQNVRTFTPTAGGNITTTALEKIKKGNFLLSYSHSLRKIRFAYIKTMLIVARLEVLMAAMIKIQVR